ncbi:hypothetical protein PGH47_23495 [Streptomyces sp. HUAS 31]|uniref:hypothetical protein n=1 Tax=Streptomyces sp. HUAS 31 TaxID=3020055 RepID=UPI0023054CD3|nr:hypothetical protein [Streptomyces sp. HUAS 31]WCD98469.1 hypothetical protein PGH47_23495 [Streptomyces sp. HUAS 31]
MASAAHSAVHESVVVASFESRHAAELMLASLGREFRKKARRGDVAAFVISRNKDDSLKVTQSRVVTAGGVVSALLTVLLALIVGFLGVMSMLKAVVRGGHAARTRKGRVASDDEAAHAILAGAGPDAAILLVRCKNDETRTDVATQAAPRATRSWEGTRPEFLADLDPGNKHDWIRDLLSDPAHPHKPS